jgi:hypothetical protein
MHVLVNGVRLFFDVEPPDARNRPGGAVAVLVTPKGTKASARPR